MNLQLMLWFFAERRNDFSEQNALFKSTFFKKF